MEEFGGYLLGAEIGRGGMGTVRRAVDADGNDVAVKILHPAIAADPVARARLAREVATLRRVRGTGVARVVDAEVEDAEAFIVTELIDGPTLQDDVAQFGCYNISELAELAKGLFEALHQIHRAGVVHRDLKPSNVMMGEAGPVLIDFGIAQVADDVRLTHTGLVAGTAGYLDPQALRGQAPAASGDWWSWAAVLTFAATGRPPFGRGPIQGIIARVHAGEVDTAGLDPALATLLKAALAPDVDNRPPPNWVLAQLQHFAADGFPAPPSPGQGADAGMIAGNLQGDDGEPTTLLDPGSEVGSEQTAVLAPAVSDVAPDRFPTDHVHDPNDVPPTMTYRPTAEHTRILPTEAGNQVDISEPSLPPEYFPPGDTFGADVAPPVLREPAPTPWVMVFSWLAVSTAALNAPVISVAAVIAWIALTSVIGNGIYDHRIATARFGRRMADPVRVVGRSVRHLVKHGLAGVWHVLLAVIIFSVAMALRTPGENAAAVTQNMMIAGGAGALAIFAVWWQPAARWARYANRALIHAIFPSGTARTAVCLALLALAIVLALTMLAKAAPVQWWPLDTIETWIANVTSRYR